MTTNYSLSPLTDKAVELFSEKLKSELNDLKDEIYTNAQYAYEHTYDLGYFDDCDDDEMRMSMHRVPRCKNVDGSFIVNVGKSEWFKLVYNCDVDMCDLDSCSITDIVVEDITYYNDETKTRQEFYIDHKELVWLKEWLNDQFGL